MANVGSIPGIMDSFDVYDFPSVKNENNLIITDMLSHHSIFTGCRLSKSPTKTYLHKDMNHLEKILKRNREKRKLIITDGVFSMDGDLAGFVEDKEMLNILSQAKVYVQVSEHEAFGCAIAEAMLCECVPVVSRVGAIPEVVGDCGYYVDILDHKEKAEKIKLALKDTQTGKIARKRIIENFTLERRREELLKAVSSLDKQR